jgi:outer membrane lipase/esterase
LLIADAFVAEAVPEPSTWVMLILGFAGIGFMAYPSEVKASTVGRLICDHQD